MIPRQVLIAVAAALVLLIAAANAFFTVSAMEQAIIFQFREKVRVIHKPGLYVKAPFLQDVVFFDKRVLALEPPGQVVILDEQKLLDVDAFGRWRIVDPFLFMQSLRDQRTAVDRLNGLLNSSVRNVLGTHKVSDLLSIKRTDVMAQIKDDMNANAAPFGVEVVDVRIRRTDLPEETVQNVYDRMRSERQKEAAALRAEGQMKAQEIRAKAETERTKILSEAQRVAQSTRGEGDKAALKTIGDAMGKDPAFYGFYRSLEAYRNSLKAENSTYLLAPEGEFFRHFGGAVK